MNRSMFPKPNVALIGTDSLLGKELASSLEKSGFPGAEFIFFDPGVSEDFSHLIDFREEPRVVRAPKAEWLEGVDLIFLASDRVTNRKYGTWAFKRGIAAIDLGGVFDDKDAVPAIVADVNDAEIPAGAPRLVANPHPVTIFLARMFKVLNDGFGMSRALALVLQPVSVFGNPGIEELAGESFGTLNCAPYQRGLFKPRIAFNLLSQVETVDEGGWSPSERRIHAQLVSVLRQPSYTLSLSLVQAPVFHSYSMMVHVQLAAPVRIKDLEELFRGADAFKYYRPARSSPVSPVSAAGKEKILIGQLKRDDAVPNGFWIWAAADNLVGGAALNAIEVARRMLSP